jgi:hypothetical protein
LFFTHRSDERKRHAKVHQKIKSGNTTPVGTISGPNSSKKLPISLSLTSKSSHALSNSNGLSHHNHHHNHNHNQKTHRQNSKPSTSHSQQQLDLNNNNNNNSFATMDSSNPSHTGGPTGNGFHTDYLEYTRMNDSYSNPDDNNMSKNFLAHLIGNNHKHTGNNTNNNQVLTQVSMQDYQMQHNGMNPMYWQSNFMDLQPHLLNNQLHNLNSKH